MDQYRMIDGKDFADFVSGFMLLVKKVFRYTIASLRQYYVTAILTLAITTSIGLYFWHNSKVFYEAIMVCSFREMDKKHYGEMVHTLDILAKDHSYNSLARVLHIPLQNAQQIISIEGKNMAGSMLFEDITPDKSPMYLDVKATNNTLFQIAEPAILNYLNTGSPYLNAKLQIDSVVISNKLRLLQENILKVDSITAINYEHLKTQKPFTDTFLSAFKLTPLLKYESEMKEQEISLKTAAQELKRNVMILHNFPTPDQPAGDKDKILRLTIVASLLSSCSIAVFRRALNDNKYDRAA